MRLLPKGAADFETIDEADGSLRVLMPRAASVTFASFADSSPIYLVRLPPQKMCVFFHAVAG